jgi:hypothetical protein
VGRDRSQRVFCRDLRDFDHRHDQRGHKHKGDKDNDNDDH